MKSDKKIIILTENLGKGHIKVANVLKNEISKQLDIEVEILDYLGVAGKIFENGVSYIYKNLIENFPNLYKMSYEYNDKNKPYGLIDSMIGAKLKQNLGGDLSNIIFISTFPNATAGISSLNAYKKYTVITDYTVHGGWIYDKIDGYFVANEKGLDTLKKHGINEKNIYITGIPIPKEFYEKRNVRESKKMFNIDIHKKTILIMGGGDGVIKDAINLIQSLEEEYNVIVITGKNIKLKEKLDKIDFKNTTILGFVENISQIMDITDIAISKSGGISMTELNAKRIPILIYNAIPGQEKGNADFFEENKAGMQISNFNKIKITIKHILNGKIQLDGKIVDRRYKAIDKIINIIRKDL